MITGKSLTEMRAIAQGYGVENVFTMDEKQLGQAILLKQVELQPKPVIEVPPQPYDARLMTKAPAKKSDRALIEEVLQPYTSRGLHLSFPDEETWSISYGKVNDSGTVRQPPRVIVKCAERVLLGK